MAIGAAAVRANHPTLNRPRGLLGSTRDGLYHPQCCRNEGQDGFQGLFRLMNVFQVSHNSPHTYKLLTVEAHFERGIIKHLRLSYAFGPARTAIGCSQNALTSEIPGSGVRLTFRLNVVAQT